MLDKSKEDGQADATIFGKFKCYCDTNTAEKTQSIADLTQQIAMLEGEMEELRGSSGKLITEVAQLTAAMTENENARGNAQAIRDKENADFVAEEADMTGAVDQMDRALETLAAVGAYQTALTAVGATRGKFLGTEQESSKGVQVSKLSEQMKKALKAASVFLTSNKRKSVAGFIQAPFTGDYSAQSGEIVGIIKNTR